jgi:chemosensory pili system protein ChpA (sensor histidine kinase/response regulator)
LQEMQPKADLILLDLSLPALSGAEVAFQIHHDQVLSQIPVVLMTAWSPKSARGIGHRLLLRKPFTPEKLVNAVQACLREPPPTVD